MQNLDKGEQGRGYFDFGSMSVSWEWVFPQRDNIFIFVLVICALHRKVDMCSSTSKVELIVDTPLATNGWWCFARMYLEKSWRWSFTAKMKNKFTGWLRWCSPSTIDQPDWSMSRSLDCQSAVVEPHWPLLAATEPVYDILMFYWTLLCWLN